MSILKTFSLQTRAVATLAASIVMMTGADSALARGGNHGGGERQHQNDHQFNRTDRQDGNRRDSMNKHDGIGKTAESKRERDRGGRDMMHGDSRHDRKDRIAARDARHKEKVAEREAKRKEKDAAKADAAKKDEKTTTAHAPMNPAPAGDKSGTPAPVVTSSVNTTHPTPTPTPASGTGSPVATPPVITIHPIPGTPAPIVRDHRHPEGASPAGGGNTNVNLPPPGSKPGTVQVDEKNSITVKDVGVAAAKTEVKNFVFSTAYATPYTFSVAAAYGLATGGIKGAASSVKSTAKAVYDFFTW